MSKSERLSVNTEYQETIFLDNISYPPSSDFNSFQLFSFSFILQSTQFFFYSKENAQLIPTTKAFTFAFLLPVSLYTPSRKHLFLWTPHHLHCPPLSLSQPVCLLANLFVFNDQHLSSLGLLVCSLVLLSSMRLPCRTRLTISCSLPSAVPGPQWAPHAWTTVGTPCL